jgi:sigma-B regulation protein RsbU (phosphoserine phosphatase)
VTAEALRIDAAPRTSDDAVVRTVLIVDDSRVQRRIMVSYLKRLGLEVIEAGSGQEALDRCAATPVDMVISDWMMPGMNGIEFCRAFRAQARENYVYFILLTSKSEKGEVAIGLDVGADDFLAKPLGLEELRARIAAGERILRMERALTDRNRAVNAALTELRGLYDSIDRDLVEARKLQQSLVRDRHGAFEAGEVNLLLQPSGHVGGDLVGFYRIGEAGLGLFSVDVSGHGIASALLTARLAGYLTGNSPGHNIALGFDAAGEIVAVPPDVVAARLNRLMLDEVDTGHYFSMALASVVLATGVVTMVQAGHPAPLVQAAGGAVRPVGEGGMPIGLLAEASFERFSFRLAPGERLLMCSDGFSECPDPQGVMLDEDGLSALVTGHRGLAGAPLLDRLVADLARHAGGRDFPDDLSAVVFDYRGRSL